MKIIKKIALFFFFMYLIALSNNVYDYLPNLAGTAIRMPFEIGSPCTIDISYLLPKSVSEKKRELSDISEIVIHHDATEGDKIRIFNHANYHIDKGWPEIGYTYYIDKTGQLYQLNQLDIACNHTEGHNITGIGICLQGNFDIETPTEAQTEKLESLIYYLIFRYGVKKIYGHNELNNTSCPGRNFNITDIKSILL